jgi:hypothetical protein
MTHLKAIGRFLASQEGIVAMLAALFVIGLVVWRTKGVNEKKLAQNAETLSSRSSKTPLASMSDVKSVNTGIPPVKMGDAPKLQEQPQYNPQGVQKTSSIDLFTSKEDVIGSEYAPYGTTLKCQLLYSVESNNLQTPIVGLVLEDYWHDGKLIVPAGTYVHGLAQGTNTRDRIGSQNQWILVWRNRDDNTGLQLPVSGIALDYSPSVADGTFAITDGSAGLRGRVRSNTDEVQAWAIITKVIEAAGEGYVQKNLTINNGSVSSSQNGGVKDALALGVAGGAQQANQNLQQRLGQNSVFVRVPAGKEFYLYVTQVIDLSKRKVGASFSQTSTGK